MPNDKRLWEIRLGIVASEDQARQLQEQIERLLCPDPDHAPPCPIPWSVSMDSEDQMDDDQREQYADIQEQYRIESQQR